MFNQSILVLIDMQEKFEASLERRTIEAVQSEITLAQKDKRPIIILEYGDPNQWKYPQSIYRGDTHAELMDLLLQPRRYDKLVIAEKFGNDGSALVLHWCRQLGFDTSAFRVCGVNTDACVSATVFGLAVRRPRSRIEVITDACNTSWKSFDWSSFPHRSNIVLCVAGEKPVCTDRTRC
jgi:nicotinamidase-related amidase